MLKKSERLAFYLLNFPCCYGFSESIWCSVSSVLSSSPPPLSLTLFLSLSLIRPPGFFTRISLLLKNLRGIRHPGRTFVLNDKLCPQDFAAEKFSCPPIRKAFRNFGTCFALASVVFAIVLKMR